MAYALLVEQLERQVLAQQTGMLAAGAGGDLPSLAEECARFDAELCRAPSPEQMARDEWKHVMGLVR